MCEAAGLLGTSRLDHGAIRVEQFLSFATLVEAIVLHDKVAVYALPQVSRNGRHRWVTELAYDDPFLGPLIDEDALEVWDLKPDRFEEETTEEFERFEAHANRVVNSTPATRGKPRRTPDPLRITKALWEMRVAQKDRNPFVPGLLADSDFLLKYVRDKTIATQSLLVKVFSQMEENLRSELAALENAGRSVPLYIPSIAALVLSGARDKDAFANVALSLRADFTETRTRFQEYQDVIRDDTLPLADSLSALRKLEASLAQLNAPSRPYDIRNAEEWKDVGTLLQAGLEGLSTDDSAGIFRLLVGKPAAEISRYLKRRDVLYLSDVRRKFLDIRGYAELLSTKRGFQLDSTDFEMARRHLSVDVRRYLPRA